MKQRTKAEIKLRARVAVYAKDFAARLYAGKIEAPSSGDCWGCCMVAEAGGSPLGGRSHILDHISERYFVPTLVFRALRRFGSRAALHNAAVLTGLAPAGTPLWFADEAGPDGFLQRQTYSAVRRFCLCEVGVIYKGRKFRHEL